MKFPGYAIIPALAIAMLAGASAQISPPRQVSTSQVRQLQVSRTQELTAALNKLQISEQTKQGRDQ